jgi:hypothetical protein
MNTTQIEDLSLIHKPISDFLGVLPATKNDWQKYKLNDQQIQQFNRDGYIKNIPVLSEQQCDILLKELNQLMDPKHPRFALWYEFHSNETGDPNNVLFHALGLFDLEFNFRTQIILVFKIFTSIFHFSGAWRISIPFHGREELILLE